jgi:hypothetical protein
MANQQVKIYCGTSDNLPDGYGRFGTRFECMRCGYGSAMMKYKWAPVSGDAKPPARARKGCYRARNPRKSPRKKSKGKKKRKRSPRKSPRKKSKGKKRKRSPRKSPRKKSKGKGKGKRSPRKSPRKKSKGKGKGKRSPRKKKSKYLSRAQINKLIKEEMHRRQK